MRRISLAALACATLVPAALLAERPVTRAGPAVFHAAAPKAEAKTADLVLAGPRLPAAARHALGALPPQEKAALAAGTGAATLRPKRPAVRVGVSRELTPAVGFTAMPVDAGVAAARVFGGGLLEPAPGGSVWTAAFSSMGAGALRLHFRSARLPQGSRAYVYSAAGEVHGPYAFDLELPAEGFWTNTVFADEVFLEVRLPAGARDAVLSVDAVVHLEHPSFAPGAGSSRSAAVVRPKSDACFVDASCVTTSDFPSIADASNAIGQLTFVDAGDAFVCTGGLLNATPSTFVPYLLTANHCFDNQAAATSLEALWQYKTASCNGPAPSPSLFHRTLGSTLLATGTASDFTFVRLSQDPPDGSVFLGWTTTDYSHSGGTILHRLSNPNGDPQIYTKEQISASPDPVACSDVVQGLFLYEKDVEGGTGGGSSGSPVYLGDLSVVGQELGACGTNTDDDCDVVDNSTVDGAFRVTFPSVAPWLEPVAAGTCVADANTLCLNGGRFRVTADYATSNGQTGSGTGVSLTSDSGYFWFFNPANIELVVKVLRACSSNSGRYWVFAGGLTNVHVVITVVDMQTGATKTYENPLGTAFVPLQDTNAFPCP